MNSIQDLINIELDKLKLTLRLIPDEREIERSKCLVKLESILNNDFLKQFLLSNDMVFYKVVFIHPADFEVSFKISKDFSVSYNSKHFLNLLDIKFNRLETLHYLVND